MRKIILFSYLLLTANILFAQPIISSFSPATGPIGTPVIITGSNFSSTAANNVVYFGAVRATVTAASAGALTIIIPAGATSKPLTVTTSGLTGYSDKVFNISFAGAGAAVNQYSFDTPTDFSTDLHPQVTAIVDLDGDGKPDVATANNYSTSGNPASFTVLRNTTSGSSITFAAKVNFNNGVATYAIAAGDVDGDGKQDIVVSSVADSKISVFRNTSTPGNISFAPKVEYTTASDPFSIVIRDLDLDGKPDIAFVNYLSNSVFLYRNTGSIGSVSFVIAGTLTPGLLPRTVYSGDVDGDGKADLAVAAEDNTVSIFRNTSTTGNISFAPKVSFTTATGLQGVSLGDLDGDGKADMATAGSKLGIFRNTGSIGNISFGTRTDYNVGANATSVNIGDLNGDGKSDVIVASANVTAHLNQSTVGTITLAGQQFLSFATGTPFTAEIADLNADGKSDLTLALFSSDHVSIARNKLNEPVILFFSPVTAGTGSTVTITGQNFIGTTAVSFGGIPATSFNVVNATTITAVVGTGYSGDVVVTNGYGTGIQSGFTFSGPPVITSFTPTTTGDGQTVTITGHDFTNVTAVSFGGTPASFMVISNSEIAATVGNGASGAVSVTTNYGTGSLAGFTYVPVPVINSFTPTTGGNGTTITLTGTNFTGATGVSFGGVPAASFIVNSNTSITAVPSTAGASGNVSVTNANGTGIKSGFTHIPAPVITSYSPVGGFTGTIITINGANFQNITSITVGGVSYLFSYTYVSSSQVTIQLDNQGGSGNIVIVTPGGTATATGFQFNPNPTLTSISPIEAATGMTVNITGTNFSNATAVTFGGLPAASFTINSATNISAVVGAGATGVVVVTNSWGTSDVNSQPGAFHYAIRPLIFSFSPVSGPVGSQVTITGNNFNTVAANNIVYFGTEKASVVIASLTSLVVTVPPGATYEPISITIPNGLTSYTATPFDVTFPGGGAAFNTNSFGPPQDFSTAANPKKIKIVDFDTDGRPDVIINAGMQLLFYRNTTLNGVISFASPIAYTATAVIQSFGYGDLDGDGRIDIALGYEFLFNGTILKNTSTPGTITFTTAGTFPTSHGTEDIIIRDMNKDGKPDMAITFASVDLVDTYRNTTSGGVISFAPRSVYPNSSGGGNPYSASISIGDFNNDGYPDLIAGNWNTTFNVFRNQSDFDNVGFFRLSFNGGEANFMTVADFNNDGNQDIISESTIITGNGNNTFSYQNTVPYRLYGYSSPADLDGDGKVDLATVHSYANSSANVYANRNNSNSNIIMDPPVGYISSSGAVAYYVSAGDLDGDGRPDIAFTVPSSNLFSILKNNIGTFIICANSNGNITSAFTGTSYQWQVNTGGGFVNISNGPNYSGVNTVTLQLINVPALWNGYQYRCLVNTVNFSNTVTISIPSAANAGVDVTVCANTNVQLNGSGGSVYSWSPATGLSNPNIANPIASPASTTTYTLTATNGTCTSTDDVVITVTTALSPAVSITASVNNVCAGTAVTFTATPTDGGANPSYQWKVNNVNAGTNSNIFTSSTLNDNDIVKVIMTTSASCAVQPTAISNSITMTVNPLVAPIVSITTAQTNICTGASATFTANPVNGGSSPSYHWFVNNVNAGSNSNTFTTTTLSNNDEVKVIMTSNAVCTSVADTTSNIITMSVGTVIPAVSITSTGTTICAGSAVTFTAAAVNGGNNPIYQWQVNGVNAGTNSNTFTTTTLANNDQVKVIMTGNAPCSVPQSATSNIVTVTVSTSVMPAVSAVASATTICQGQTVTFTVTPVNGGATPAYQWQVNGANTGTNSPVFLSNTLNNNDQVKVIMTSSAGCALPASATSSSITMSVGSTQTPSVSVSTPSLNVCPATPVTFTATPVNGGSTPAYQWLVNGVNSGTNSNTFTAVSLNNNDQIKVIMTSSANCAAQPTATSNTLVMSVVVVTPAVSISTFSTTVCSANNLTFTATPVNGGSAPSYQWRVNGANAGTNSSTFTTSSLANADVVSVIMTSNAACVTQPTATSNSITMSIGTIITPAISLSIPVTNICAGNTAVFTATATNAGPAPLYQWKKNGINVVNNGSVYTTSTLASGDVISVQVTASGTCASPTPVTSNAITVVVTPAPVISISGNTTILAGSTSFITASIQNAAYYIWQDSTVFHSWQNIPNATIYGINYSPAASGVKLRCRFSNGAACGEGISNVLSFIVEPAFGDPSLPNNGIVSFPNPASSFLTIDKLRFYDQWNALEIRDSEGKTVFKSANIWGQAKVRIDVRNFAAGMYLITVSRKKGNPAYIKFIKI